MGKKDLHFKSTKRETTFYFIILLILLTSIVLLNTAKLDGNIRDIRLLACELQSAPHSPQDWGIQIWIPMKYRVLFRWLVLGTWSLVYHPTDASGFLVVYRFWSLFFLYASVSVLYVLLRHLAFDRGHCFWGCFFYICSPSIFYIYLHPVHTREDPMAFFLVGLAVLFILKSKPYLFCVVAVFAALCRETTLIVLLLFFFYERMYWPRKVLLFLPALIAVVLIRITLGFVIYNPFEGFLENISKPVESAISIFLLYGLLWIPFLAGFWSLWRQRGRLSAAWRMIVHSVPVVFPLLFGAHLFLARVRELRISTILFPILIPIVLCWFRTYKKQLKQLTRQRSFKVYLVLVVLILVGLVLVIRNNDDLFQPYMLEFYRDSWLYLLAGHLIVTFTLLFPFWKKGPRRMVCS